MGKGVYCGTVVMSESYHYMISTLEVILGFCLSFFTESLQKKEDGILARKEQAKAVEEKKKVAAEAGMIYRNAVKV